MKTLFLVLSLFALSVIGYGQSITWQKVYRGFYQSDYYGNDVCPGDDNNFFIIGTNNHPSGGTYIIKINPYGDTLWTKLIIGGLSFTGVSSNDGGCVVTGIWYSSPVSNFSLKLNSVGEILWVKVYDSCQFATSYEIIRTSDNKYVACGRITINNSYWGFIIKIDSEGNLIWHRTYPSLDTKIYKTIIETSDFCYLVGGLVTDSPTDYGKGVLTKIDSLGNIIWEKRYNIFEHSMFNIVSINKENQNFLICGDSFDSLSMKIGFSFKKINYDGNVMFSKFYPQPNNNQYRISDSKVINFNKYLFCYSRLNNANDTLLANAIITDSLGNILKQKEYAGTDLTIFYHSILINNGDILFVGNSNQINSALENIYLVRTDSNLYAPSVPIFNISSNIPDGFKLYQNYPNPFNPVTKIRFEIPLNKGGQRGLLSSLKVFDILGKEIATLVNEKLSPGSYEVSFDGSNLSGGVYFYKLSAGNFMDTKKMMIVK